LLFSVTSPTLPYTHLPSSPSIHPIPHPGAPHTGEAFEHGKENAHSRLDKTDERTIGNTLKDAERVEQKEKEADEAKAAEKPTDAARAHGNEPSRGAKIDEKIEDEEAAIIAKMDAKKNH
jgi:hypothetical protein